MKMKQHRNMNSLIANKKIDNYIVMKDYFENLQKTKEEVQNKFMKQNEFKHTLDQQVKDNVEKRNREKFLTEKELIFNKPIIQKMVSGNVNLIN